MPDVQWHVRPGGIECFPGISADLFTEGVWMPVTHMRYSQSGFDSASETEPAPPGSAGSLRSRVGSADAGRCSASTARVVASAFAEIAAQLSRVRRVY